MATKTIFQHKRFKQLIDHMKSGKLAHKVFSFGVINYAHIYKQERYDERTTCGTTGCMLGECPAVFPKDWYWTKMFVFLTNDSTSNSLGDAEQFFGMTTAEALCIFEPFANWSEDELSASMLHARLKLKKLTDNAELDDCIENMEKFYNHKIRK